MTNQKEKSKGGRATVQNKRLTKTKHVSNGHTYSNTVEVENQFEMLEVIQID